MTPLEFDIRRSVAGYLSDEYSLNPFSERLGPLLWSAHKEHDVAAEDLAHEIELGLAEFSNGDWSEDELREQLRPLVTMYVTSFEVEVEPVGGVRISMGSSSSVFAPSVGLTQSQVVGTRLVEAS